MKNFGILITILILISCSDQPSREKFPGAEGRTTDVEQAQSQKAVMGGTDSFSQSLQSSDEENSGPDKTISGTISLDPSIKLPSHYLLFVAVRRPEGGPPLAVLREPQAKFPYSFFISKQNVMIPGTKLTGKVVLSVSVDQDGDPISKSPGDAAGFLETEMGKSDLKVLIDKPY